MKKWLAPIFGFVPFLYGVLVTFSVSMMPGEATIIVGPILAAVFLVMWCQLAKIANYRLANTKLTILYMHIPGILVYGILSINAALPQPFLTGWFASLLLYYQMPVLPLAYYITLIAPSVYLVYVISLVFMVCSAYFGCNSKRRQVK